MNKLQEYIQAETERRLIANEMEPLQARMNIVSAKINSINDELLLSVKAFINRKLMENLSQDHIEAIQARRDELEKMLSDTTSYSLSHIDVFDPEHDEWHLVGFETNEDKMRFQVSCKRREGTISGLLTFLDSYWTSWFNISELSEINNGQIFNINA